MGKKAEKSKYSDIPAIGYGISLTIACFIICRIHPKSVWYTPVICSIPIISSYFTMIPFSTHLKLVWIILGCGIVLSVMGSIVGARMGLHLSNQVK
jgi:hypothetical protein